jgi:hypothetical protein
MDYANKHLDKSDNAEITENDVYIDLEKSFTESEE